MTLASQPENQQYFHQRLRIQTEARVCLPDIMRSVSDKYNTYPWGSIKMGGNPILPNLKRGRHASPAALDSPGRTAERTWLSKMYSYHHEGVFIDSENAPALRQEPSTPTPNSIQQKHSTGITESSRSIPALSMSSTTVYPRLYWPQWREFNPTWLPL